MFDNSFLSPGNGLLMSDAPLRIRQALPYKIRELNLNRRTRKESEIYSDSAEYDFEYSDEDNLENELAELYSYTETGDLQNCQNFYENFESNSKSSENWHSLSESDKKRTIHELFELFEQKDVVHHSLGTQCLLYILQGKYNECNTLAECLHSSTKNAFLVTDRSKRVATSTVASVKTSGVFVTITLFSLADCKSM